ncbi:HPr family phosphocarrier protein [Candidatus Latescibacterota bacterium]
MGKIEKTIKLINKLGLHARPAALLVHLASNFSSDLSIEANGMEVNGKSIMGVMMLAAPFGCDLTFTANGDDAENMLTEIEALINRKFDEE